MDVPEIDVAELARLHPDGVALIDVREPEEYQDGHVPGSLLVPLGTVADRLAEVPDDKTVYVICAAGARSYTAAGLYRANGRDAVNVAGGMISWVAAGHPVTMGLEP